MDPFSHPLTARYLTILDQIPPQTTHTFPGFLKEYFFTWQGSQTSLFRRSVEGCAPASAQPSTLLLERAAGAQRTATQ